MATNQINGKVQHSTHLRHTKTPKLIYIEIGMRDYFMDGTWYAKLGSDRFVVTALQIRDFDVAFDVTSSLCLFLGVLQ